MSTPKINGLAHFGLYINDIERSVAFYKKLGFEPFFSTKNGDFPVTFIRNNDCVIELVQFPDGISREDGWFDHVALSVTDIDGVKADLESKGIVFEEDTYTIAPHCFENGSKWVLFRGPDGEHIELNERL